MSKAMSSSYELVEEDFSHEKKGEKLDCSNSTCQIVPSVVHKQVLRNMRHQRYCHILKGFVGKCDGCGQNFTSSNLIWNAVKNWKAKLDNNDISNYFILDQILPLSRERIDCLAMRYSYDMEYFNRFKCDEMEKILKSIILFRFNEHDFHHRKGCFKKTEECRFHYPKKLQVENELIIDWTSTPSKWISAIGNSSTKLCYPFTMETKRHIPDLFLNTNNPFVSKIFGYNNNVMMGNRNCIYYVTLYNTKGNQEEEQFPYLKH